jgi:hypothetical protein
MESFKYESLQERKARLIEASEKNNMYNAHFYQVFTEEANNNARNSPPPPLIKVSVD